MGSYLNIQPGDVKLSTEQNGKPVLACSTDSNSLYFNTSHSQSIVLYGFTYLDEIGVDIEFKRTFKDMMQISERYFSQAENEILINLPEFNRAEGFFNCWTRKEAFIKTHGEGLSRSLKSFDVSILPETEAKLMSVDGSSEKAREWSLIQLNVAESYAAAACIKGIPGEISCFTWGS